MRLLIDLQACQSTGSRDRGIGRYSLSLAKAMLENAGNHDCHILLSTLFPETVGNLREIFSNYVPAQNIHLWDAAKPVAEMESGNLWRCRTAEFVREQAIAELAPDVVHVSSLFEGSGDDAVTSVAVNGNLLPTAVTLYDLIPLVYEKQYLTSAAFKDWYYRKLTSLKRADLLLAISESSRLESIRYLGLAPDSVVNISSAVDEQFQLRNASDESILAMRKRYGLVKPFVMYTGGIDQRKNIDGLIAAYASLPVEIRTQHQLAIVCSVRVEERQRLISLAHQLGLSAQDVILTGYVPDHDLPLLYQECKLFVFPSWHEGFGLPVLEAMSCGAAVIASNCSSLPEVVGCKDALFDPHNTESIASKIAQVLNDPIFAQFLRENGLQRSTLFSWRESAKKAITALEQLHASRVESRVLSRSNLEVTYPASKLRCAYISPLPRVPSGIADYSAELIPALAKYYDITLIVDQAQVDDVWLRVGFSIKDSNWLIENHSQFDRVIYHFGNSSAHLYMYPLFDKINGTIVLHDYFLGDSLAFAEMNGLVDGLWTKMLYQAHGYASLLAQRDAMSHHEVIERFPCSPALAQRADGVIVHSMYSRSLIEEWQGTEPATQCRIIPHLRAKPNRINKEEARKSLGIDPDAFLVCSFGVLGPNKLNKELLAAWGESELAQREHCHLVFVGQNDVALYGKQLQAMIDASPAAGRIRITGYADIDEYRNYLQAADMAVQLRAQSRGETSGTVIDCMAYGLPLIFNRNGSMDELPSELGFGLSDRFSVADLQKLMEQIYSDPDLRDRSKSAAREYVSQTRQPADIARQYWDAIEFHASETPSGLMHQTVNHIAAVDETICAELDVAVTANALARNKKSFDSQVVYVLVGQNDFNKTHEHVIKRRQLEELLIGTDDWRIEFVQRSSIGFRYARSWAWRNFALRRTKIVDEPVNFRAGDSLIVSSEESIVQSDVDHLSKYLGLEIFSSTCSPDIFNTLPPIFKSLLKLL